MPATTLAFVCLAVASSAVRVSADAAACPSAEAVEANVASLLGESAELRTAEIVDLGDHYRVVVGDKVRELIDGERRCEERARAAAVFIALALDRPAPPVVAPNPPPVVVRALEPKALVEPTAIELQAAVFAALPFGTFAGTTTGIAGAARAAWSPGRFGVAAGIAVAPAITVEYEATQIRMFRVPIDASLRVRQTFGAFDAAAEVGALAALLSVLGDAPASRAGGVRLELGVRAALSARVELGPIAPFFAVEGAVIPSPYEVASHRDGSLGHTPTFWLGLGAGVSLRID